MGSRAGRSLQLVSANSSFLRLILSFNPSASLRAAVILACICSPDISEAILIGLVSSRTIRSSRGGADYKLQWATDPTRKDGTRQTAFSVMRSSEGGVMES